MQQINTEYKRLSNFGKCYSKEYGERLVIRYLKQDDFHKEHGMLAIFSIDNLNQIINNYGKVCACDILFQVIQIICEECNRNDVVYSRKATEFIVMFRKKYLSSIKVIIHKIFNKIHNLYSSRSSECIITCSCGTVNTQGFSKYKTIKDILDKALIIAKNKGGNYIATDEEVYASKDEMFAVIDYNQLEEVTVLEEPKNADTCSFAFDVFSQNLDISQSISIILAKIAKDFKLDRIVLLRIYSDQDLIVIKDQYARKEINLFNKKIYNIPKQYLKSFFDEVNIEMNDILTNTNIHEIIREQLRLNSVKSQIHFSIYDGKEYVGNIFYDTLKEPHLFTLNEKRILKEVSNIIGTNVIKNRAKRACQMKTEFLTRMSHEIRNPLNVIQGMINIAINEINDKEFVDGCLRKMNYTANYLSLIINDIIDMAKIESGKMVIRQDAFCINDVINNVIDVFKFSCDMKSVEIIKEINIDDQYVIGDSLKLSQVLINLIANAIKFTPSGGKITIGCKEINKNLKFNVYYFYVKDTGIGIDVNNVNNIFSAFTQENPHIEQMFGGSGLGLTISNDILRLMGSKLQINNNEGAGTKIEFTLNLQEDRTNLIRKGRAIVEKNIDYNFLTNKKVLLVEDDPLNCEVCKSLLEKVGCVVKTAINGFVAVNVFNESKQNYFDIILMDLQMPIMDGYQASVQIRHLNRIDARDIPIVVLTANVLDDSIRTISQYGMNGYISKPIDFNLMYKEIIRLIKLRENNL